MPTTQVVKIDLFWVRLFYFLPLGLFGIMHFIVPEYFMFLVPRFVPGGVFWIYFSGVALTGASVAITFKIIPKVASYCLILFVLTFIGTVDIPGMLYEEHYQRYLISFLKDTSLCGGTILFLRVFLAK